MTDRASVALAALRKWDDLAPKCPFGCTSGSPTATTGGGSPASKQESPRSPNQPQRTASPPPARTPTAPVASDGIPPLLPPAQIAFGAEQMATHSHFVRLRTHVAERPRSKTLAVNASQVTVAESLQPIENIPAPVCYLVSSTQRYKDSAVDSFCPSLTCGDARACGAAAEDDYRAAILRETGEGQRKSDAEPTPVLNKKERAIAAMRSVVSQNKIRFQEDGFDLDLTYITPRIIAMGFPSTGRESYFRNPMPEVERFFAKRHPNHFRVYNLCCEREYDAPSRFGGRHRRFPFEDHNAPNDVALIPGLIKDAVDFLKEDDDNVVAIHCKAGKGRTGLMVSCLLMATEPELRDPQKALDYFSDVRTNDSQGVTIPSQKRYVGYWGQLMADYGSAAPKDNRRLYLNRLTITSFIKAKMAAPLDVYFIVHHGNDDIFDSRKTQFGSSGAKLWAAQKNAYVFDFITAAPVTAADDDGALAKANANNTQLSQRSLEFSVSGDVKFTVFSKNKLMADEELFHFWFNSTLCEYPSLRISKFDLDGGPNKDKKHSHYAENLAVEFVFEAPQWMASRQARDQQAQSAGQEGSAKKKESGGFFSRVFGSKK